MPRSRIAVLTFVAAIVIAGRCLGACGSSSSPGADVPQSPAAEPEAGPDVTPPAVEDAGSVVDAAASPAVPLPAVPLHTDGRWIEDANGKRFKLASVSWYGAEELDHVVAGLQVAKLEAIARHIRELGFNSVRLPWSNELYELDPIVAPDVVAANPELAGKHAMEVFDAVIAALAHEGLVVVLTNHVSRADWCCNEDDGNGLWYTAAYPETSWLADWRGIVKRYAKQAAVVGAELRNELRKANGIAPVWGGSDPTVDWHGAATRGGNAVLGENPSLLVVVDGLAYAADLSGVYALPVVLAAPGRLVYAAHDYAFFYNPAITTYADYQTKLGQRWGYILTQGQSYTAPIWVSEFGTCNTGATCIDDTAGQGFWFKSMRQYLAGADIDWSYWSINGTEARGATRTYGAAETYGVLDPTWQKASSTALLAALQALQPATQFP